MNRVAFVIEGTHSYILIFSLPCRDTLFIDDPVFAPSGNVWFVAHFIYAWILNCLYKFLDLFAILLAFILLILKILLNAEFPGLFHKSIFSFLYMERTEMSFLRNCYFDSLANLVVSLWKIKQQNLYILI